MPLVTEGQPHEHAPTDAPVSFMWAAAEGATDADDGQLPADMGLMGLCLAVLALAWLAVAGLLRARGWLGDPLRKIPRQLAVAPARSGTADPSDRHRLQVRRC
jgi:hypothetical protein